jgi:hypothetical protein
LWPLQPGSMEPPPPVSRFDLSAITSSSTLGLTRVPQGLLAQKPLRGGWDKKPPTDNKRAGIWVWSKDTGEKSVATVSTAIPCLSREEKTEPSACPSILLADSLGLLSSSRRGQWLPSPQSGAPWQPVITALWQDPCGRSPSPALVGRFRQPSEW